MKITKIAQVSEEYTNNAEISIYDTDLNREVESASKTIPINFVVEIEARSWGIKDINAYIVPQILTVPLIVTSWDANNDEHEEQKVIQVDLSKLSHHKNKGSGVITVSELHINLDKDFNVDYKTSYLDIDML